MKGWHIVLACALAVALLLFAPALVRAQTFLQIWPLSAPQPSLHYDCGRATGTIRVRVELAGRVTADYVVRCKNL